MPLRPLPAHKELRNADFQASAGDGAIEAEIFSRNEENRKADPDALTILTWWSRRNRWQQEGLEKFNFLHLVREVEDPIRWNRNVQTSDFYAYLA